MSTRPGSTLEAMALVSLGPEPLDEPVLPDEPELPELPELPLLPEKPRPNGEPPNPLPDEPEPERKGRWPVPEAGAAERLVGWLFQAAWPMPTPAARTARAAPPTSRPLRTLWVLFVGPAAGGAAG